jgi:hypothetical protein
MEYHNDQAGRNGRVIALQRSFASERVLDLPETGEVWIERSSWGWRVHHSDYAGDHAAVVADHLLDRGTALAAALAYALSVIGERAR